ncbi:acetyl-CoA synthetase [Rugosimonospora africana]|uniref:Acetyl-CoA synthetase n=1 Tax=Rugosimonospora africana TaxID=556532 RepID=A0A8J3QWD6_9ACTN|nr:acetyl-CoA synthetase [Rugosimonospora africana]
MRRFVEARQVAVFGANERRHHTRMVVEGARAVGFPAESVHLINPRFDTVLGLRCHPDATGLDLRDGVAVIVSAANSVVPAIEQAAAAGCRAAVVLAEGFAGRGEHGEALEQQLRQTARRLDIALLGPNTLGLTAPGFQVSLWTGDGIRRPLRPGAVSLLFQSSGMLNVVLSVASHWRLGVRLALSVGNEGGVELVEALEFAGRDEGTRTVGVYCEAIHDPHRVARALAALAAVGKPVVMLSSGRSDRSRRNALAHAGRLASGGRSWEALCRKAGVILVGDLDEFLETLFIAEYGEHFRHGGAGLVTVSGGDVGLLSDLAAEVGLDLPVPGEALRAKIAEELGAPDTVGNPLDCGGFTRTTIVRSTELLCGDDAVGIVAFRCMQPPVPTEAATTLYTELVDIVRRHGKLPVLMSRTIEPLDASWFELCARLRVPLLMSYRPALLAIRNFLAWSAGRERLVAEPPEFGALPTAVEAPPPGRLVGLADATSVVAGLGIDYVASRTCAGEDDAVDAAEAIGYPVAVKGASSTLAHKSRAGAVYLDVRGGDAIREACRGIARSMLAAGAAVEGFEIQRMLPAGPQLVLGMSVDPVCGRVVLAGRGGVDVEYGAPPLILIPPLGPREAREATEALVATGLLAGVPEADEPAYRAGLTELLAGFCRRVLDLPETVTQIDINPLILASAATVSGVSVSGATVSGASGSGGTVAGGTVSGSSVAGGTVSVDAVAVDAVVVRTP